MTADSSSGEGNDLILAKLFGELERRGTAAIHEYRARYPHLASEIDRLVPLHEAVERSTGDADPSLPQWLGDFRIVGRIDHGGMGEIYEAIQERLHRRVAIKVIRQGRVSPTLRERFLREQEVLARLHQTHIVPIHTADEIEGLQYFAMPYIEGGTLRHAVSAAQRLDSRRSGDKTPTLGELACGNLEGPCGSGRSNSPAAFSEISTDEVLSGKAGRAESTVDFSSSAGNPPPSADGSPPDKQATKLTLSAAYFRSVASTMADAADALQHAHDAGVLHRDVKPSNIMVNAKGQCCLIDFGLAGYLAPVTKSEADHQGEVHEREIPQASGLLGTPNYMAPEQINCQAGKESDIWGLGATLYELLALRRPFEGASSPELFWKIQSQDPPPPRQFVENVPRDLAAICGKALRKKPSQRYASASELADDLRRWMRFEPTRARPARAPRQAILWAWRNKGWAAAVLVVLLIGLPAIAAAYMSFADRIIEARTRAEVEVMAIHNFVRERFRRPNFDRKSDVLENLKMVAEPRQNIVAGPVAQRLDLESRSLFAAAEALPELVVREQAELVVRKQAKLDPWPVAIHPRGKMLVVGTSKGPKLWRRGESFQPPSEMPGGRLEYHPSGKWLLFAPPSGGLELWDAELTHAGGQWRNASEAAVLALGFTADGQQAIAATAKGLVQPLSLPRLDELTPWILEESAPPFTAAAFGHDATRLAVGNSAGHVSIHARDGRKLSAFSADREAIEALAWSPHSRRLAVCTRSGTIRVWDPVTSLPEQAFYANGYDATKLQFTWDGSWLLAARREGGMRCWDVATGEPVLSGRFANFSFAADGTTMAASVEAISDQAQLAFCELVHPTTIRQYSSHLRRVQQVVWSADNRTFASLDEGFEIRVWRLDSPAPLQSISAPHGEFYAHRGNAAIALSGDGRLLAFASGGRTVSHLSLYNAVTGAEIWHGDLGGAFEHLAAAGNDRFLLARDEIVGEWQMTTKLYDWRSGAAPQFVKILRSNAAGERGTPSAFLATDGRNFVWAGPYQPADSRRAEVWETATGKRVFLMPILGQPSSEPRASISEDGSTLWVDVGSDRKQFDLGKGLPGKQVPAIPLSRSADGQWTVLLPAEARFGRKVDLQLVRGESNQPWLELGNYSDAASTVAARFSPNSRYLAWGNDRGGLKVAELQGLRRSVAAYEAAVMPQRKN